MDSLPPPAPSANKVADSEALAKSAENINPSPTATPQNSGRHSNTTSSSQASVPPLFSQPMRTASPPSTPGAQLNNTKLLWEEVYIYIYIHV